MRGGHGRYVQWVLRHFLFLPSPGGPQFLAMDPDQKTLHLHADHQGEPYF